MLAVRRVVRDLVDCPAAVCSVCVLLRNKGEDPPPGYRVISKVCRSAALVMSRLITETIVRRDAPKLQC